MITFGPGAKLKRFFLRVAQRRGSEDILFCFVLIICIARKSC